MGAGDAVTARGAAGQQGKQRPRISPTAVAVPLARKRAPRHATLVLVLLVLVPLLVLMLLLVLLLLLVLVLLVVVVLVLVLASVLALV